MSYKVNRYFFYEILQKMYNTGNDDSNVITIMIILMGMMIMIMICTLCAYIYRYLCVRINEIKHKLKSLFRFTCKELDLKNLVLLQKNFPTIRYPPLGEVSARNL
jgi:hypothetical protein